MSYMKHALDKILNCNICDGAGVVNVWVSDFDLFDFDFCECNPYNLVIENEMVVN